MVSTSCFGTTNAARPPTLKNLIIFKRRDGGVVERARLEIVLRRNTYGGSNPSLCAIARLLTFVGGRAILCVSSEGLRGGKSACLSQT